MIKKNLVILAIVILVLLTIYNIKENFDPYDVNKNRYSELEDLVIDEENTIIEDEVKFEKLDKNEEIELLHDKILFLENFIKNYPSIKIKSEDINLAETINKSILDKYNNSLTSIRNLGSIVKVLTEEDGLLVPGNITLGEEINNEQISYSGNLKANVIKQNWKEISILKETYNNNVNKINDEITQYNKVISSSEKYLKFYKMFPTQVLPNVYGTVNYLYNSGNNQKVRNLNNQILPKQLKVYRFNNGRGDVWFGIYKLNSNISRYLTHDLKDPQKYSQNYSYYMVTYDGLSNAQNTYKQKYGLTQKPNLKAGPWIENVDSFKSEFATSDGMRNFNIIYRRNNLVKSILSSTCNKPGGYNEIKNFQNVINDNSIKLDDYLWTSNWGKVENAGPSRIPLYNSYIFFRIGDTFYGPLSNSQMMGIGPQSQFSWNEFSIPLWTDDVDNYNLDKNLRGSNGTYFEPVIHTN